MRVVNCTTAAQYFHLLRRQAAVLLGDPLPLVVMTPKSLLRHPMVACTPRELAEGGFQKMIGDEAAQERAVRTPRLLLCSGKMYVDLVAAPARADAAHVALGRVEELYPFPANDLRAMLEASRAREEMVWVQEEPENMGAWGYIGRGCAGSSRTAGPCATRGGRACQPRGRSSARHAHQQQIARRGGVERRRTPPAEREERTEASAEGVREKLSVISYRTDSR